MPETTTTPRGCICGCGQIPRTGRVYMPGHNLHPFDRPEPTSESLVRMSHVAAQKLTEHVTVCQLQRIGGCKGPLDTAHVDGNEFNNVRSNLKKLCRSHHRLLDLKVITMRSTTMPMFRERGVGSNRAGERRYLHQRRGERQRRRERQRAARVVLPAALLNHAATQPIGIGA